MRRGAVEKRLSVFGAEGIGGGVHFDNAPAALNSILELTADLADIPLGDRTAREERTCHHCQNRAKLFHATKNMLEMRNGNNDSA
jgi:hypothetical protein